MILLVAIAPSLAAPCAEPLALATLDSRIHEAEVAWAALDMVRFHDVMDEIGIRLPCLDGVVSPGNAAHYHFLQGLRLYAVGDERRAEQAFAAARFADPTALGLRTLVPDGHEIHEIFGTVPIEGAAMERLPEPKGVAVFLDGTPREERPRDWPTVLQVQDDATQTHYLLPGEATPPYPHVRPPLAALPFIRSTPQLVFLGTGLGGTIGAGVLYALAASSASSFEADHPDWDAQDLQDARAGTNRLVLGSGVAGGVAVVGFSLGAVSGRW